TIRLCPPRCRPRAPRREHCCIGIHKSRERDANIRVRPQAGPARWPGSWRVILSARHLDPPPQRNRALEAYMRSKLLHGECGERTFAIILDSGDETMHVLQEFAARERVGGAQLTAIGALSRAKLAFFEWETKQYRPIPVDEQVEVASLVGDIAIGPDGKPSVHLHAVLGRRDGTALAGHLVEAHVRPTLEIILRESPVHLCKVKDPESGLALIKL